MSDNHNTMTQERATILVSGKVQGVGLRNSVKNVVKEIGLKGSVENLEDESVLIICEGDST